MAEGKLIVVCGQTGAGKTTLVRLLAARGFAALDADEILDGAYGSPSHPCFRELVELLGRSILARGRIDRDRLRDVALGRGLYDASFRVTAKYLGETVAKERAKGHVILATVYHAEIGLRPDCVIHLTCPEALQRARIKARDGWDDERIDGFLSRQPRPRPDEVVVVNDGTPAAMLDRVLAVLRRRVGVGGTGG